jgi:YebC/PmpR family DNA-binding regulatory protein
LSGHSKWASIKHKKAATDAKRGQLFTKLARDIMMAARQGDSDPDTNAALRLAVQKARAANMPSDNIERAVKRGSGTGDAERLEEVMYEGYGPGGTAVLVAAVTDNRNRTVAEVRAVFSRNGGTFAENGAVSWQFDTRGVITIPTEGQDPEAIALAAIEAGALDIDEENDGLVEVITEAAGLHRVREALEAQGVTVETAEIAPIARNKVELDDKDTTAAFRLFERLDDLDDVSRVYSNAVFDDRILEAVAGA